MDIIKMPKRDYSRSDPLSKDRNIYVFRDLRRVCKVSEEDFCKSGGISIEELQEYEKMYFSEKEPAVRSLFDKPASIYRKVLKLGIVPLFSYESDNFFIFLKDWLSAIDARNIKEANEMRDSIACFFEGAYEDLDLQTYIWRDAFLNEWYLTYMLYSVKLFLIEDKVTEAGEFLEYIANVFEDIRSYSRWLPENMKYHYNLGYAVYYRKMKNYEKALIHYKKLKILETKMSEDQLQKVVYGHALTLNDLGQYTQAREKLASSVTKNPKVGTTAFSINWLLGLLSAHLGHYETSEALMMECLEQAREAESEYYICSTSHNLGFLYYCRGNYSYAPKFFDDALKIYTFDDPYYLVTLYYKALCLREIDKIDEFKALIAECKERSSGDSVFELLFESAECLLDIKNPKNFDFVYSKLLDVLLDERYCTLLLYYCDVLLNNMPDDSTAESENVILRTKCKVMEIMYKGGENL